MEPPWNHDATCRHPGRYGSAVRYRIEMPGTDDGAAVRRFVATWIEQPALRRIVEEEGGRWPAGTLEQQTRALHEFSARWDFRGGAERLDMTTGGTLMEDNALMAAAEELGLTANSTPTTDEFEHALVLGGTALASIYRARHLYDLRASGVGVRAVGVLTALRPIAEAERTLVAMRDDIAALVSSAVSEFDVMVAATERFSNRAAVVERHPDADPGLDSAEAHVGDALILAAPSGEPGRRANTRDNYDVYAGHIGSRDRVLVVTSSIYLPYQFFIAIQALGWHRPLTIEAVGFPPEWMRGVLTGPQNVLQELRSAFYAALRTLELLPASSR
jgi:hypothetical protein